MGGSVLTDSNGIVSPDVGDGKLGERGHTNGGSHVVCKDKEGCTGDTEDSVVSETVHDRAHGVLSDSEIQVSACIALVSSREGLSVVSGVLDVVLVRSVEVGRSGDVQGDRLGDSVDHCLTGNAGGDVLGGVELGDGSEDLLLSAPLLAHTSIQSACQLGVCALPCCEGVLPFLILLLLLLSVLAKEVVGLGRDIPLLLGESESLSGLINILHTSLSVSCGLSSDLRDTTADLSLADNHLGLSVLVGLCVVDGCLDGLEVVAVLKGDHVPAESGETVGSLLRHSPVSHLIKSDCVGIIHDNQIVKSLMPCKGSSLREHPLLHAPISAESEDVMVNDLVLRGVEASSSHLGGSSHTDCVGDALTQGAGGGFDTGCVVLRGGEFGVTGGHGVVLAETLQLILGKIVASQVKPRIQEHRTMTGRKNKSVSVQPLRIFGVLLKNVSVENGTDLSSAKGKTKVPRLCGSNGVHGKTTGLVSGTRQSRGVEHGN
mmetsp:Transcript_35856/g.70594  ORF Transcript_35856/g.70594 Transcript_35856/m.70594 type:complete len:488 (-) Transcript_35856:336-1799(-)